MQLRKKPSDQLNFPVIDVFSHFYPEEYLEALRSAREFLSQRSDRSEGFRDLDYRIKIMDKLGIDMQVMSIGRPTLDDSEVPVHDLYKIARIANDGMARVVERQHDRFAGIGTVSLLDVDRAIDELDRCVKDLGLLGVQILSNVRGEPLDLPQFDSFYGRLCQLDVPLWIHPTDVRKFYDWATEFGLASALGWDLDESFAILRIVRGGVLERYPKLKIITHHMGSYVPFLARRIDRTFMRQGKDGRPPMPLSKRPLDYMKMFYVDTAEGAWLPALVCSKMFYGSDHMLFASDYPFHGDSDLEDTVNTIKELDAEDEEKQKIFGSNALKLLNIKV